MVGGILDSNTVRSRVNQLQEPEDFLHFFPQGFIVLQGPRVKMIEADANIKKGSLFRIIAPYGNGARAVQQSDCCASKLNSHQVYCVVSGDTGFLWRGEKSNENEHKLGAQILDEYKLPNKVDFDEGKETEDFWAALGGKDEYTHIKDMMLADNDFEPMLFEVSNKSGYMNMKQVPCFTQQSLITDEVYILDNWNQMFVWVGTKSNKFEKNGAYRNADKYIDALHDGRKKEVI